MINQTQLIRRRLQGPHQLSMARCLFQLEDWRHRGVPRLRQYSCLWGIIKDILAPSNANTLFSFADVRQRWLRICEIPTKRDCEKTCQATDVSKYSQSHDLHYHRRRYFLKLTWTANQFFSFLIPKKDLLAFSVQKHFVRKDLMVEWCLSVQKVCLPMIELSWARSESINLIIKHF